MATKVSKAARIRELLAEGKTTREVADIIGCNPAYVRVAGRQRGGVDGYASKADLKYYADHPEATQRWRERSAERWNAFGRKWAKTPQGREYYRLFQKSRRDRLRANHVHA